MKYHAFISYSHEDAAVTLAFTRKSRDLTRRWHRLSPLDLYLDREVSPASPSLPDQVRRALAESQHFVLVVSRASAASRWVRQEVDWWLTSHAGSTEHRLLLVLTEGELKWDPDQAAFDARAASVLPECLVRGFFREEPQYVDLRRWANGMIPAHEERIWSLAVAELAAGILGCSKNDVVSADEEARRTTTRVLAFVVVALLALVVLSLVLYWRVLEANARERAARLREEAARRAAEENARMANGRAVVLESQAAFERGEYDVALLLGLEAWNRFGVNGGAQSVLTALQREPRLVAVLPHPDDSGRVFDLAFSADATWLACGHERGVVHIWDMRRRSLLRTLKTPKAPQGSLAFSANQPELVVLAGGEIMSFSLATGAATRQSLHVPDNGGPALVARDASLAVSSGHGIELWDLRRWAVRGDMLIPHSADALALSGNGRQLALTGAQGQSQLWNVPERRRLRTPVAPGQEDLSVIAVSEDGGYVAAGSRVFGLWQQPGGKPVGAVRTEHASNLTALAFDGEGVRLASASLDQTVRLWKTQDLTPASAPLRHDGPVAQVTFGDHGLFASGTTNGSVLLWDLNRANGVGDKVVLPEEVASLAVDPGEGRIHFGSESGALLNYDQRRNAFDRNPAPVWAVSQPIRRLLFSPDGSRIAIVGTRSVRIDQITGETLGGIEPHAVITTVAFTSDGSRIAVGDAGGAVGLYTVADQKQLTVWREFPGWIYSIAVDDSGKRIAASGADGAIVLWDARTFKVVKRTPPGSHATLALQFAHRQPRLFAVDEMGELTERSIATLAAERRRNGELQPRTQAAVFDRAQTKAALVLQSDSDVKGALGATLRVIDLRTHESFDLRTTLRVPTPSDPFVAFTTDGSQVVLSSSSRAFVFDVEPSAWKSRACAVAGRNLSAAEWSTYVPAPLDAPTCQK